VRQRIVDLRVERQVLDDRPRTVAGEEDEVVGQHVEEEHPVALVGVRLAAPLLEAVGLEINEGLGHRIVGEHRPDGADDLLIADGADALLLLRRRPVDGQRPRLEAT